MSYPYFFISKNTIFNDTIVITGEDYRHLTKVLRSKAGDYIEISDNEDTRYGTVLERIDEDQALLKITRQKPIKRRIPQIFLFLCILKKDAMEFAIQKNVEIGVDTIIPVFSKRVVVEIEEEKRQGRLLRWQQIAYNASKQCRRDFICKVSSPLNIDDIETKSYDIFFMPDEDSSKRIEINPLAKLLDFFKNDKIKKISKIAYIIGPEGGLEDSEMKKLSARGAIQINFGENILRSETASTYFSSILDFLLKVSYEANDR